MIWIHIFTAIVSVFALCISWCAANAAYKCLGILEMQQRDALRSNQGGADHD